MPIVRSYMCPTCAHAMSVTLSAEQWDDPPPECPRCSTNPMAQEFSPPGIIGSTPRSKAEKITEDILAKDYHVGDINRSPSRPHLHYQDQSPATAKSSWQASREVLEGAMRDGRAMRKKFGSGLDVLQSNLRSGVEPDLIALSKKKAIKIW